MSDKDKTGSNSGNDDQGRKGSDSGSEAPQGRLEALLQEWDAKQSKGTDSGKADQGKAAGTGDDPKSPKDDSKQPSAWAAIDDFDYDRLLEDLKGDLDVEDFEVDGWLKNKAVSDPRIIDCFNNRHSSELAKGQFRQIRKALTTEFREYAKNRFVTKPGSDDESGDDTDDGDRKRGNDRRDDKGLGAAVRSARDANPDDSEDDLDWAGMSDHEFARQRAKVFKDMKEGRLTPQPRK